MTAAAPAAAERPLHAGRLGRLSTYFYLRPRLVLLLLLVPPLLWLGIIYLGSSPTWPRPASSAGCAGSSG